MNTVFYCNICTKYYKSYQSLWNHNKRFHFNNDENSLPNHSQSLPNHSQNLPLITEPVINKNVCELCNIHFTRKDNLTRHLNKFKCNEKLNNDLQKENTNIKLELEQLKKQMIELMNTNCKMHHKTFNKIKNNGIINTGPVTNNNINIVALGKENMENILSKEEKLMILNKRKQALNFIIEYVHFNNKFPQFQNIIVTNNRTNEAHMYDHKNKSFQLVNKHELVEDLIEYRICDIEEFYGEFGELLDDSTKDIIENFCEERGSDDATCERIKLLLFNNRNKVKQLLNSS
jgi:hypothetical protein